MWLLMDAVQLVGQEAKPAGSLYLHVHNPTLSYEGKDDIEQQMLKKYQFDGLFDERPRFIGSFRYESAS